MSAVISREGELRLPERIAKLLGGKMVDFVETKEGVLLRPIDNPIREARGMLKGTRFTSARFLSLKKSEKERE
jgi:hypothetical protein